MSALSSGRRFAPRRWGLARAGAWLLWGLGSVGCGSAAAVEAKAVAATPPSANDAACSLSGVPDGWAAFRADGAPATALGGAAADAAHTYEVATRKELVLALSPDAVFAPDGSFTSERGPDDTPKIIHVHGTISLNTNAAGVELTEADYACDGYDFAAYTARYDPLVYNRQPLVGGKPPKLPTSPEHPPTLEALRICSSKRQRRVVMIHVGSNTSILGVGSDARIVHGTLVLGPPPLPAPPRSGPDGVVIRNISFEDAFDFFPAWDPTDAYAAPPQTADAGGLYPRCQATYSAATDSGPQQCPGGRWNSEYDNVSLLRATHVWIDHCTFSDGEREDHNYPSVWRAPYVGQGFEVQHHDGLVDITSASDFVTLSYNVFRNHDKTTLVGGSDRVGPDTGLGALSVTLHHNHYDNAGQRMPRVRFGKVHVYDNYVTGTLLPRVAGPADIAKPAPRHAINYGMGIGYLAKLYSENNVYELRPYPGDPEPDETAMYELFHKAPPTLEGSADRNEQTYFFDSGSVLNGKVRDLLAHANARAARLSPPKPALPSTDTYWRPSRVYAYTLTPAAEVKADVTAHAGVCRSR